MSADSYGTAEAGRLLGLSPRRVRQLVADGRLVAVSSDPLRVDAKSLLELRDERRSEPATTSPATGQGEQIAAVLDRALQAVQTAAERAESAYRERLAISDRTEQQLRDELFQERARALAAEQRVAELERIVAESETGGKRRKRKRRKG